jgi:hypothetical protein
MDIVERTEWISLMENKYSVQYFNCMGIDMWPVLRYHWLLLLKSPDNYKKPVSVPRAPGFIGMLRSKIGSLAKRSDSPFKKSLEELNKTEVLLLSRESEYTEKVNDNWINRYIDPFIPFLRELSQSFIKIETKENDKAAACSEPPVIVSFESFAVSYIGKHPYFPTKVSSEVDAFSKKLPSELLEDINISRLSVNVQNILLYKEYFKLILEKTRPKHVFLIDYYSSEGFGLTLAAKEKKIKSADIQHGKQGTFHPMYSHFAKFPVNGYNTLPDYFFNWGDDSVDNILSKSKIRTSHTPIVIGNAWICGWVEERYKSMEVIPEIKQRQGKVILFSLQPVDDTIPPFVAEAINNSPPDWKWLIRFHPSMKKSKEFLNQHGINSEKTEFEYSSKVALMSVLPYCDYHITCWSSVCYEAALYGVHTAIIHPTGWKLYDGLIETGIFSKADNSKILEELVKKSTKEKNLIPGYVICSSAEIKQNLSKYFQIN